MQINNANKKYLELLANSKDPLENNCLAESTIDLPTNHAFLPNIKIENEEHEDDCNISSYNNKGMYRVFKDNYNLEHWEKFVYKLYLDVFQMLKNLIALMKTLPKKY